MPSEHAFSVHVGPTDLKTPNNSFAGQCQAMRLQLTIHRQGIPPVHVLWTLSHTRPPLAAAGSSIITSQFLEQVNEIIPLESEDWGLEDYVVEVRGFECLHFWELGQVLKEDDAVWYVFHSSIYFE